MYQNKEIVIDFHPAEGVSALHMDEFPLSFLGRMEIGRASTIDFNPETQRFDINLKEATRHTVVEMVLTHQLRIEGNPERTSYPEAACGFAGYDEARGFEVAWIQECMKRGVDPLDSEGIEVINELRLSSDSPQL